MKGANKSKADFVAWWREHVMEMAMMLHQWRNGAGADAQEKLEKVGGGKGRLAAGDRQDCLQLHVGFRSTWSAAGWLAAA
jgi:hypothetical protein